MSFRMSASPSGSFLVPPSPPPFAALASSGLKYEHPAHSLKRANGPSLDPSPPRKRIHPAACWLNPPPSVPTTRHHLDADQISHSLTRPPTQHVHLQDRPLLQGQRSEELPLRLDCGIHGMRRSACHAMALCQHPLLTSQHQSVLIPPSTGHHPHQPRSGWCHYRRCHRRLDERLVMSSACLRCQLQTIPHPEFAARPKRRLLLSFRPARESRQAWPGGLLVRTCESLFLRWRFPSLLLAPAPPALHISSSLCMPTGPLRAIRAGGCMKQSDTPCGKTAEQQQAMQLTFISIHFNIWPTSPCPSGRLSTSTSATIAAAPPLRCCRAFLKPVPCRPGGIPKMTTLALPHRRRVSPRRGLHPSPTAASMGKHSVPCAHHATPNSSMAGEKPLG